MLSSSLPSVLVYRSLYGQISETFVRDHVHGLSRFRPLVLTNRIDPRGPAEEAEMVVVPNSGLWSGATWRSGQSRRMHNILVERRPILIHAHFLMDGASILPYAKKHSIPLVVTAHGYDATTWPEVQARSPDGRLLLARQEALGAYASRILCVSDFIRDELIKRGYPADVLITHPLGVDTETICPRAPRPRRGILTVGRLVEKKGTRFLIKAYAALPPALRAEHPLTIIGDGPLRSELASLAAEFGVVPVFLGGCSRERVMAELADAAVFCLPSVRAASGDAEGMPIAIMEALALAVPIVVFDGQAAGSILRKYSAGIVARAADTTDLAEALEHVLNNPAEAKRMTDRGRHLSEQYFDSKNNNAALSRLYEDIASAK